MELQCDVFGDWAASRAWMESSSAFAESPIGAFVDPDEIATAHAAGERLDEIRRRIWVTDDVRPAEPPDLGGPPPRPGRPTDAREVVSGRRLVLNQHKLPGGPAPRRGVMVERPPAQSVTTWIGIPTLGGHR